MSTRFSMPETHRALYDEFEGSNKKYFTSATAVDTTTLFHKLEVLSDTVFASLSEYLTADPNASATDVISASGPWSGTIAKGTVIRGAFTNLQLTSGSVRAWYHS